MLQRELPPLDQTGTSIWLDWWSRSTTGCSQRLSRHKEYGSDNEQGFSRGHGRTQRRVGERGQINDHNEIIVSVSVPIQRFRAVLGALVLSNQRRRDRQRAARGERKIVFFTFAFALVTILLSIFLAGTIAEPIRRLASAAELVRRGINKRVEIPDFTQSGTRSATCRALFAT